MKKKKSNPRLHPVTMLDVKRAKKQAEETAIEHFVYILMYSLVDNLGYTSQQIEEIGDSLNYTCDSIVKGYVNIADIKKVIAEEYGFVWKGHGIGSC